MAEATVEQARASLLEVLERNGDYAFLTLAARYLQALPEDDHIRLLAARSYLELGLIAPARELVEEVPTGHELASQLRGIGEALAGVIDTGRMAWDQQSEIFRRNMSSLRDRAGGLDGVERAWREAAGRYELYVDRNGIQQVRVRGANGGWRWIPLLGHHGKLAEAQPLPEDLGRPFPGPYLFDGLELGHLFRRIHQATARTFLNFSCALYVVEPDPVLLGLVLHLEDWSDLLANDRVYVFTGRDAAARLGQLLDENPNLPIPSRAFRLGGCRAGGQSGAIEAVQGAAERREHAVQRSLEDLNRRYADRDVAYWADRFERALAEGGSGLRIVAAVSRHTTFLQHSMRDAVRAFEVAGHRCVLLKEENDHEVTGVLSFHAAIREHDPDVFFNLDHLRPEFGAILPDNLPVLTWDQDQLPTVFTDENMKAVARHDFLAGCSKTRWISAGCDPRQYLPSIVPTCPEQFSGAELSAEDQAPYDCDVSYISHASQTPEQFHDEERSRVSDAAHRRLLDELYALTRAELPRRRTMHGGLPLRLLAEAEERAGVRLEPAGRQYCTGWYLWRLADRMFRHEALEWAAAWARDRGRSLRIYGNGWERHPSLGQFAAGPADNGRELLWIYRASRINLQLMPAGFIHQRALDGLAAGGFFLARLVPHDLLGGTLGQLVRRMDELKVDSTRSLLESGDSELRATLERFYGADVWCFPKDDPGLYANLRVIAELPFPDQVFAGFGEITFDSAEEFAARADYFLGVEGSDCAGSDVRGGGWNRSAEACGGGELERGRIAAEMRSVVLSQFTYRATMTRFLGAMRGYLHNLSV